MKTTMMHTARLCLGVLALTFCGLMHHARANDQMREWTLASGEKKQGEILAFDETTRLVTLRLSDKSEVQIKDSDLSTIDQAWILQWVEQDEEARALLKKLGGTVTEYSATGNNVKVDYAVYQPATATTTDKPPMLILFHPGGNGRREIYRYVEAAAALGVTLVSFDYFKNCNDAPKELEVFKAVLPQVKAIIPHDPNKIFMGGISGAAERAYWYSATVPGPWAGVFADGGWLGGRDKYSLPYPRMRVAMVNGDKDQAANYYLKDDTEVLQKAGCIVSVHAFEGGHQLAPPSVQIKALRWLLDDKAFPEK